MLDTVYRLDPFARTLPFRDTRLLPDLTVDSDIETFVGTLDLLHLYHLDRLCVNAITTIGMAIQVEWDQQEFHLGKDFFLAERIPTADDIRSRLRTLENDYPQAGTLIDFDLLTKDVTGIRMEFQEKRTVTPTVALRRLEMLQAAVQQAIVRVPGDEKNKPVKFLESFALGAVNPGDEEALVYLCSRGKACDRAIEEVDARWRGYRKEAAGHSGRIKAMAAGGNTLRGATLGYATAFRLMQWAEMTNFKEFWGNSELFDAMMPKGMMPDGLWSFSLFRSDELIRTFKTQLEMLLITWQEGLVRLREGKGPAPIDRNDYAAIAAVAAAFVFGYHRMKTVGVDKRVVKDVANYLLDARQLGGTWCREVSGRIHEKDVEITAMVVHALSLARRNAHKRVPRSAAEWLGKQRQLYGCWGESSPTYRTVLVLDAIELASGRTQVTFKMPSFVDAEGPRRERVGEATPEKKGKLARSKNGNSSINTHKRPPFKVWTKREDACFVIRGHRVIFHFRGKEYEPSLKIGGLAQRIMNELPAYKNSITTKVLREEFCSPGVKPNQLIREINTTLNAKLAGCEIPDIPPNIYFIKHHPKDDFYECTIPICLDEDFKKLKAAGLI